MSIAVAAQRCYPKDAGLLIALSGGPGQSSVDAAGSFAISLAPMLRKYRLVVLDQRGTGLSGALNCPGLQRVKGLDEFTPQAGPPLRRPTSARGAPSTGRRTPSRTSTTCARRSAPRRSS